MKSFISIFSITLLMILSIIGCTEKKTAKYYRRVSIDGRYAIKGENPISRSMGQKGESYRFSYNKKGELIKVEHFLGRKLRAESFFGELVAQVAIQHLAVYEERRYLDLKGNPVTDKYGVYYIRLPFDENNNPVSRLNYKYGIIAEDNNGVAQYVWTLDNEGRRIKAIFYGVTGKRVTSKNEGFETHFKYDEAGSMIERSYLNSKGALQEDNNGVAILRQKFDEKGNIIEMSYFDSKDRLTERGTHVAIVRQKFNEDGNIIEERYFDKDEKLNENNMGVAIVRSKFDAYDNMVERRYYDSDDKLTEGIFYGFAIRQYKYDKFGRLAETRFLDTNGNLTNAFNDEASILRMQYDKDGNLEQILYFDKEGKTVEETTSVR
jgi:YD repeat-containing protein